LLASDQLRCRTIVDKAFFGVARMEAGDRFGEAAADKRISAGAQDQHRDLPTTTKRARKPAVTCGMAIMAKASAPGRTKTRLVPPLTFDEAAALNTAFLQDIAGNIQLAGCHIGIAGYIAFAPSGSEDFFRRIMPSTIGLIDASRPSLGDCLLSTSREILARGHDSAVLLNGDSPTLPTGLLIEAANVLAQPGERAVLGPSSDGGYYLIGLKTVHCRLFEDIAWSTEHVAAQTLERAREINLNVHVLPTWYDVDNLADLRRLSQDVGQLRPSGRELNPHAPHYPAATAAVLANLREAVNAAAETGECSGKV
jgi:rSAM/selenodomain-associated transferase 1